MENKILVPLRLQSLHHAEMGQIAVRFFEDFENSGDNPESDADFKKLFYALKDWLPQYRAALDQVQANEESGAIASADALRDEDFIAVKTALKAHRTARTAEEQAAYTTLKILLDQYRGVEANSYEEETLRLNNLLSSLSAQPAAAALATLGLQKFVANLQASNDAFNTLFAHRSTKVSQKIAYDVKALRRELEGAYRKFANFVETMAGLRENAFYADTLAILNTGRKYFSDLLARRQQAPEKPGTGRPTV